MEPVSEHTLDQIVERFDDSEAAYERAIEEFQAAQPILLSYLFSEEFEVFTPEEKEFMLLLATIIFTSVTEVNSTDFPQVNEKMIADAEEHNWELIENAATQRFHERLDIFFQDYPQEDLLAFVEDALAEDDEDPIVTKEAREAMFVTLKTVIDCLTQD